MATEKKTQNKNSTVRKAQSSPKKNTQKAQKAGAQTTIFDKSTKKERDPNSLLHQFIPCILVIGAVVFSVFLAVSSNEAAGAVGGFLRLCAYGLFGWGAWLIPASLIVIALMWKKTVAEGSLGALFGFSLGSVVVISALIHTMAVSDTQLVYNPVTLFVGGEGIVTAGGAVGGFISCVLIGSIQKIATYILLICAALVLVMFTLRLTPHSIMLHIRYKRALSKERARAREEALASEDSRRAEEYEKKLREAQSSDEKKKKPKRPTRTAILCEEDMPEGMELYEQGAGDVLGEGIEINMFTDQAKDKPSEDGEQTTLDPITEDMGEIAPIDDIDLRSVLIPPEQADVLPDITVDDDNIGAITPAQRPTVSTVSTD